MSRLAGMDQAIHKLNVGHYTLDVKVSQLMDRLSRMDGKTITFSYISLSLSLSFFHFPPTVHPSYTSLIYINFH